MDPETNRYWFPAKKYGWGWGFPQRWEGWVVMGAFLAAVIADGVLFAGRQWVIYFILIAAAVGLMVAICWWKGSLRGGGGGSSGCPV